MDDPIVPVPAEVTEAASSINTPGASIMMIEADQKQLYEMPYVFFPWSGNHGMI